MMEIFLFRSQQHCKSVLIFHILANPCFLGFPSILAVLVDVKWCLTLVLTQSPLGTEENGHLHPCPLAVYRTSLEKCCCKFFAHFSTGLLFVLNFKIYTAGMRFFSDKSCASTFSHLVGCLLFFDKISMVD